MVKFDAKDVKWLNEPSHYTVEPDKVEIITDPGTDFWQRTYYGFRNDNAHVLFRETQEQYFSFTVKCEFDSHALYDQCGIAIYQSSDCWAKVCAEYNNEHSAWLGSVITNAGYSDWATTDIKSVSHMWYRLSRRESDFCFEYSGDGITFKQMRIFHLTEGAEKINFGLFACSPTKSSFKASFTRFEVTECLWEAHE